jgi:hypothetical protein
MVSCNKGNDMQGLDRYKRTGIAMALTLMVGHSQAQSSEDLLKELRQLRADMQHMKQELDALKQVQPGREVPSGSLMPLTSANAVSTTADAQANRVGQSATGEPAVAPMKSTATLAPAPATADAGDSRLSLFGYGELYYTRPRNNVADAVATARRGVLGFGYRFNDRTRFVAELEIENAVVSASDQGEAAFEQLYVEHDISDRLTAKAGLFLLPIGYMNESHEPTRFYGVTRNLVETAIIPTTWREMGVGLQGTSEMGLRWNAGVVTSFDLNKWPTDSAETQSSPLGAIHQEGQLAKAASLAYYGALNYDAIPGVNLGGSVFSGGIGQKQTTIPTPNASVHLAEVHAKWQVGKWELSSLLAQGQFRGVSAFNAAGVSGSNPVPDQFRGWYAQAAYRLWRQGDYSLSPFARYEQVNTAIGFSGLAPGLAPATDPDTRVLTVGASFYLHPQVVLKMDTQRYLNNSNLDRINLGVGFHY